MSGKRIFKTKTFGRWSKKVVSDAALCVAAWEIAEGIFEADLGKGFVRREWRFLGKEKAPRCERLWPKNTMTPSFFLAGREKSQPGADFTPVELEAAKGLARAFERANGPRLNELVAIGVLLEICHEAR